ncbi:MAG: DEAD/DEAH box helicase, partial [Candidatus Helarchaeota archaeon]
MEIKGLISNLLNLIKNIELERSDLLKKRDELLSFVSDTQRLISEWIDASKKISKILGVPIDNINIRRLKELAKIALLCFSKEKPEKSWLNPDQLKRVLNVLPHAKKDYEEFNSIRERLGKLYTDEIYELDLDNLIERYSSSYRSFLKWFRPSFHNDQKKIAGVSLEGRVPKSVLKDLLEARRLNELKTKIDSQIDTHRELFGHFYDGFHTNFERIEQACAVAEDIIKLSRVRPVPSELIELVSFDLEQKAPPPELKRIGTYLNDSINKWEEIIKDLDSLLPIDRVPCSKLPIYQTHLIDIQKWASETEKHLSQLCLLTKEVLNSCKDEPDTYEQLIQDLRKAENIRKKETEFLRQKRTLQEKFGVRFSGLTTDWEEIISILEWTKNLQKIFGSENIPDQFAEIVSRGGVYASSNHGLPTIFETYLKLLADLESRFNAPPTYQGKKLQDLDIELLYERIKVLRERVDDLQVWMDFKETRKLFRERGLEPFLNKLIECAPPSSQIIDIFFRAIYQEWIDSIFDEDPNLGRFRRENHERMIAEFRNLDQKLIRLSRYRVIQEANARKPQGIKVQASDAEVNILIREATKKRRQLPIRVLFKRIPNLLFRLKPCLLMSPVSVSQFLSPELMSFDLVIFDEASQILPEDAIGAIYRGKTIVVAGDNKQLPPTPFFQKSIIDDYDWDELSDDEVEVFESILDELLGIGLPRKMLKWHYRSKHEDLISFSNHRFYEGQLITFPSALSQHETLGVKFVYVPDGVYDRGGRRDNLREAEVVADLVFEHIRKYPTKTLGVVTFNIAQMEAIEEAIERRRKIHDEFEWFFKEDRLQGF